MLRGLRHIVFAVVGLLLGASIVSVAAPYSTPQVVGGTVNLATGVTGVLPQANGGTGGTQTTVTAFAGGGQGSATALSLGLNIISVCASTNDSVKLPTPAVGDVLSVINQTATAAALYPQTSQKINGLADNAFIQLASNGSGFLNEHVDCIGISVTVWQCTYRVIYPGTSSSSARTMRGSFTSSGNLTASGTVTTTGALTASAGVLNAGTAAQNTMGVAATVAAAGATSQANATALTAYFNTVTTSTAVTADGVKLPAAAAGMRVRVKNRTANTVSIFPASGDVICNEAAACAAADAAILLVTVTSVDCYADDATTWECK